MKSFKKRKKEAEKKTQTPPPPQFEPADAPVLEAQIFDNLNKLRAQTITLSEMQDLLRDIVSYFYGDDPGQPMVSVQRLRKPGSDYAEIARFERVPILKIQMIYVDAESLVDCIHGKVSFVEILDSIGHEYRHFVQYAVHDKIDSGNIDRSTLSDKQVELMDSLTQKEFSKQEIDTVYQFLKYVVDDDYVKKLKGMSDAERAKTIQAIVFSQYCQLKYEEDARDGGLIFAKNAMAHLFASPQCDKYLRNWLAAQAPALRAKYEAERRTREKVYQEARDFKSEMEKITIEHFRHIEDMLKTTEFNEESIDLDSAEDPVESFIHGKTKREELIKYIETLEKLVFSGKSVEELQELFLVNMKAGYSEINNGISELLEEKQTPEQREEFGKTICDLLVNGDLAFEPFHIASVHLLTPQQQTDVAVALLQKGRLSYAQVVVRECVHTVDYGDSATCQLFGVKPHTIEEKREILAPVISALATYAEGLWEKIQAGQAVFSRDLDELDFLFSVLNVNDEDTKPNPHVNPEAMERLRKISAQLFPPYELGTPQPYVSYDLEADARAAEEIYGKPFADGYKEHEEISNAQFDAKIQAYQSKKAMKDFTSKSQNRPKALPPAEEQ